MGTRALLAAEQEEFEGSGPAHDQAPRCTGGAERPPYAEGRPGDS
jgi:hypothetical protein